MPKTDFKHTNLLESASKEIEGLLWQMQLPEVLLDERQWWHLWRRVCAMDRLRRTMIRLALEEGASTQVVARLTYLSAEAVGEIAATDDSE